MAKIITYHGSMDALVWLKERKGMDSDTELVVPFSHEVIFVKNGKMTDSFTVGRYNLSECAVGEGRLFATVDEHVDCRIYFVKKEDSYNIKFAAGVLSIVDPVLKVNVQIDLNGVFAIKIIDSKKFLSKLLAFTQKASLSEVKGFFRGRMLNYISNQLVAVMGDSEISVKDLPYKLMPVSKDLELKMRYIFENYGVRIEGFMLKSTHLLCYGEEGQENCGICGDACKITAACGDKTEADKSGEKQSPQPVKTEAVKKIQEIKGETMYCPKCGVDIPPLSKFCYKCGKKID